jgi:hypothetical protein
MDKVEAVAFELLDYALQLVDELGEVRCVQVPGNGKQGADELFCGVDLGAGGGEGVRALQGGPPLR